MRTPAHFGYALLLFLSGVLACLFTFRACNTQMLHAIQLRDTLIQQKELYIPQIKADTVTKSFHYYHYDTLRLPGADSIRIDTVRIDRPHPGGLLAASDTLTMADSSRLRVEYYDRAYPFAVWYKPAPLHYTTVTRDSIIHRYNVLTYGFNAGLGFIHTSNGWQTGPYAGFGVSVNIGGLF